MHTHMDYFGSGKVRRTRPGFSRTGQTDKLFLAMPRQSVQLWLMYGFYYHFNKLRFNKSQRTTSYFV